jgi:hypothetical protein
MSQRCAQYRCRPCLERTGQVIYRAGHKCPVQAVPVSIPPDQPFDLSAIFLAPETLGYSSSESPDILNSELSSSTPVIDNGVNFGAPLWFLCRCGV